MEQDFASKEVRRVDRWIAYVVNHAWIKTGIFLVAFLEATILPILPEIVVGTILTYRKDLSWKLLSVISALGSTTGAAALYLAGRYLYASYQSTFDAFLEGSVIASYTDTLLNQNSFIAMFVASFTPLPDRVFAFLAGLLTLNIAIVVPAFFLGRLTRVGIVAYFSYHFGDEAREYILRHTKTATISVIFLVVLYIGFKYFGIL
jgi:membrane protein YqaA with SNARE-associated domain